MIDNPARFVLALPRPVAVELPPRPVLPESLPHAECASATQWVQTHGDRVKVLRWSGANAESGPAAIRLSVVIPMYNEEARVSGVLADSIDYLRNQSFPTCLMLVDDGSSDRTSAIAVAMLRAAPAGSLHTATLVCHAVNRGKASAIRTGLWLASGAHRLVMDADGSTPLSEVRTLLDAAEATGAGLVVGSRALRRDMVRQSFKRHISHLLFRAWARANGFRTVRDSQCGFKLYRADVAEALCAPGLGLSITSGYEFDLEHIELSRRLGHRVQEVPVIWVDKPGSKVRLERDAVAMVRGVRRLRKRLASLPEGIVESKPSVVSGDTTTGRNLTDIPKSLGAFLLATHSTLQPIPEALGM
ncbi:MAG: glycosyltransferase [Phycisphaerales bacterium]|jgi:dolichyl-phosphate beta-glucosyltransferase